MSKIILASNNPGKLRELRALFSQYSQEIAPQSDFNITEAAETGTTFVENAIIKARHAAQATRLPAIGDDSGLIIDALNGKPGVHSARFVDKKLGDQAYMKKLLASLDGIPIEARTARYACVLVYLRHADDPLPIIVEGLWEGSIAFAPRGTEGFGFDPVFYLPELDKTVAELGLEIKNKISHRARAMNRLLRLLNLSTST